MSPFFGVIGILAFLIGLVMLFINLVKKKSKKQPLIILIVGFLLFIIGVAIPSNSDAKESKKSTTSVSTTETKKEETKVTSQSSTKKPKPSSKVLTAQEKAIDGLTGNSLAQTKTAISYLYTGHMSKQGLYDQLTSEYGSQMTVDEANNAINRIDPLVNWNNLAILSAKSYRETGNLTGQALIDQLTSEYGSRFTPEQAQYGVLHIDDEVKSSAIWN
ncbi:MAG: Ltp family lipoprotein [Lactococcus cremoris]|uniref:Ltp family lipoprotein n=1 Tax=Lactococcus lactis subsp. cremoris TaxID=1359 RepID=A0AAX4A4Y5_LACLC|nr:Ltp family lipoprotein [Lactococcus cremoris]MCD6633349.1 Ltp family lipoprotein [Lactococcus cremoris]MDM7653042.1 Ltp family lipoprotein [Lactococcus cremoris]QSE64163.1 Ltp family lipoprotein [Lactococcus cremoris]WMX69782.1 Ltp family lipoprotein [Lactococcus cremoris]